ncbi:hypothetical protein [Paenibacillus albus]|uniref:Copper amine oxidase N-terminal domain-containing protein n=1 Tax=Paenibacillus albus TaxID=2495582 RepID=A0A3Q8X8T1_9BACL|nr:hypothetical protein [Paenibacillus albus]AZN42975.1 hypothetical protein EJC50_27215 [Paenibacillus albus]
MNWTNKWKSSILLSVVSAGLILSPVIGATGTASAATATTKATTAVTKAQTTAYTVVLDGKKLVLNPAAQQINGRRSFRCVRFSQRLGQT